MSDRVVVLVQARAGSQRLPGKALRPLAGRPMLAHVLDRARSLGYDVVLATSVLDRDDGVAAVAAGCGIPVVRGSEWDVLGRMADAARLARADTVVRITGDCPLWAPDVGVRTLALYRETGGLGYVSNDTLVSGWPDGTDVEVFSASWLYLAAAQTREGRDWEYWQHDREHVTPWIRRHAPCLTLRSSEDWRAVKLSVDSSDDFARVQGVLSELNGGGQEWSATKQAYLRWREREAL